MNDRIGIEPVDSCDRDFTGAKRSARLQCGTAEEKESVLEVRGVGRHVPETIKDQQPILSSADLVAVAQIW
jgi:hypothetical protein